MNYWKFQQGDKVKWNAAAGLPEGSGTVIGVATNPAAVIGASYIVKLDNPELLHKYGYDYEAVTIFEISLEKL